VIGPMIFVVSLCNVMVSPYCTMKVWMVSRRSINSLDDLSILFWFTIFCYALKALSIPGHFGACLPPFAFWVHPTELGKSFPPLLDSLEECKSTCTSNFPLKLIKISPFFLLLGIIGGFFISEPPLALVPPLL
jgi:hypothetical protein